MIIDLVSEYYNVVFNPSNYDIDGFILSVDAHYDPQISKRNFYVR